MNENKRSFRSVLAVATWLKFDGFLVDGYPKMLRRRIILGSKSFAKT